MQCARSFLLRLIGCLILSGGCGLAWAQNVAGVIVTLSATGEVTASNDQAQLIFSAEEQQADVSQASASVNQKMNAVQQVLKKIDPQAILQTQNYFSYPVYADNVAPRAKRQQIGWRVGQSLSMTTTQLTTLPQAVVAAQKWAGLSHIQFGLSDAMVEKLSAQKIQRAYQQLRAQLHALAATLGKKLDDATIESLQVDGANLETVPQGQPTMMAKAAMADAEPSFQAGETQSSMTLTARVKFQ